MFDELDYKIINELQKDARVSVSQIARDLGHPIPTIRDRIKRLEKNEVIKGYKAEIDLSKLGYTIKALIQVPVSVAVRNSSEFLAQFSKVPEIESAFLVTGDYEAVLLIHARDVEDLRRIVYDEISQINGVSGTNTMLIFADKHWDIPR